MKYDLQLKLLTNLLPYAPFEVATKVATREAPNMKFVNVKELKNKTSSILHYAESGDDVIVTFRGKTLRRCSSSRRK